MRITFFIEYYTRWGQQLFLTGEPKELGSYGEGQAVPMHYLGNGQWLVSVEISSAKSFVYGYFLRENGVITQREWGGIHCFRPTLGVLSYRVYDTWQDIGNDHTYLSSAFLSGHFLRNVSSTCDDKSTCGVRLEVLAPEVSDDEILAVVGTFTEIPWSIEAAVLMSDTHYPTWTAVLPREFFTSAAEYKYVILDKHTHELVVWEEGENRRLIVSSEQKDEMIVVTGAHLHLNRRLWKGAGVAIPVFSLRSEESWGIGEFLDLEKMVDWAVATGQRIIQILPINDTTIWHTWLDSYPYRANSIYALHPAYLHLPAVGRLRNFIEMSRFEAEAKQLNTLSAVDYEAVTKLKHEYVKQLFAEQCDITFAMPEYKRFFKRNKEWLVPYAVFCYLRDKYNTPVFTDWGDYAQYNPDMVARLASKRNKEYNDVSIHYFIQYHLHKQLSQVREYALSQGVVLKGDIPIGVSRDSADAWSNPRLFNFSSQAGAPPDDFSVTGQNWGFPTYNWPEMAKDGYAWWKARFSNMAEYFDAYRIDHILGFFRIWEIPDTAVEGLPGHFNAALPYTPEALMAYGFVFDEARHAEPYIRECMLPDLFGEYVEEVKAKYLIGENGTYTLRPEVATQQKIQSLLSDDADRKTQIVRAGLFSLTDEVLFVKDPYMLDGWHPRISAQNTSSFKALPEWAQHSFERLHNDFYYHRHNQFWKEEALKKLPTLISSTNMLVCGEDLGMIPQSVPEVMNRLQILSLEIERMPKEAGREYGDVLRYPYLSVCTTSTHDMSGIRGWWEEDPAKTQRYYNEVLGQMGDAPEHCPPYICQMILERHLQSPSVLAIFPLQDWLSISTDIRRENPADERINVPADPQNYWHYRMHLTLEKLLGQAELNTKIREIIEYSGR